MPLSISIPALPLRLLRRRSFWSTRRWLGALAGALIAATAPAAFADQADSHEALVQQLIEQQHALPLAADCAAHAAFVVPTSPVYARVEFLDSALDAQHASIEPWNKPFDDRKQRITVDTMVSVSGLGYRQNASAGSQPDLLTFRCGYVADKLLAFGYNEPDVPASPHASSRRGNSRHHAVNSRTKGKAHGGTTARGTHKTTHSTSSSKAKPTSKKAAPVKKKHT